MLIEEVTEDNVKDLKNGELRDLLSRCALIWQRIAGDKHEEANKA